MALKRPAIASILPALKRRKIDYTFFDDPTCARGVQDITLESDDSGYIEAQVVMLAPRKPEVSWKIGLTSKHYGNTRRFDATFSGRCLAALERGSLAVHDIIKLALHGASVRLVDKANSDKTVELEFSEGVSFKFVSRKSNSTDNGRVFDTWTSAQGNNPDDDWYSTQRGGEDSSSRPERRPTSPPRIQKSTLPPHSPSRICSSAQSTHTVQQDSSQESAILARLTPPPSSPIDDMMPVRTTAHGQPSNSPAISPFKPIFTSTQHPRQHGITVLASNDYSHQANDKVEKVVAEDGCRSSKIEVKPSRKERKAQRRRNHRNASKTNKAPGHDDIALESHTTGSIPNNEVAGSSSAPIVVHHAIGGTDRSAQFMPASRLMASTSAPTIVNQTVIAGSSGTHSTVISNPITHPVSAVAGSQHSKQHNVVSAPVSVYHQVGEINNIELGGLQFTKISDLENYRSHNVIGIVTCFRSASRCGRDNDWTMSMEIIDSTGRIKTNLFAQEYAEWLPDVQIDDIVILSGLKGSLFQGRMTGVGYKDRLKWMVYTPSAAKFHRRPQHVLESARLDDKLFSPFLKAEDVPNRNRLCAELWDWYKNGQAAEGSNTYGEPMHEDCRSGIPAKVIAGSEDSTARDKSSVGSISNPMVVQHSIGGPSTYQIGSSSAASGNKYKGRQHHLICEVSPTTDPGGYFDCTVEVLHTYPTTSGLLFLYVTDYTAPMHEYLFEKEWCPSALDKYVLKIELSDGAAEQGAQLEKGDVIEMKNCRMKDATNGYAECTMRERKIYKLDPTNEKQPHQVELLKRKRDIDAKSPFEHKLLEEVCDEAMYNFTVEIIHKCQDQNKRRYIYITDFSSANPRLLSSEHISIGNGAWSQGLDRRIMKISLGNGQEDVAQRLEVGKFYSIAHLRVREDTTCRPILHGILSGSQMLINLANTKKMSDETRALTERKNAWLEGQLPATVSKQEPLETETSLLSSRKDCISIKQARAIGNLPHSFRVIGKVTDSIPKHARDFTVKFCDKCKTIIGKTRKACLECDDLTRQYVRWKHRFSLIVKDEEDQEMTLIVTNEKARITSNPVLRSLRPEDLNQNEFAFFQMRSRMRELIGDTVEKFDNDGSIGDYSSWMVYEVIASMESLEDKKLAVYYLVGYEKMD